MLKKTFLLIVTISSCMVLMPSLPESEDDSSFIGFNANNFAIGPNHPDMQKIEKLESACVEALKKNEAIHD